MTPITEIDFCNWIDRAAPGDILEYHRGFLARDAPPPDVGTAKHDLPELNRVALRAWRAAEDGLVHLVQRRNKKNDYSYLAVARPKRITGFGSRTGSK